jgi:hypothetical protein
MKPQLISKANNLAIANFIVFGFSNGNFSTNVDGMMKGGTAIRLLYRK